MRIRCRYLLAGAIAVGAVYVGTGAAPSIGGEAPASRSGSVEVDGGSLYYEESGKGPALVFIHGGFGDRRMWDDQFSTFARDHRVIRYDHRGYGKSSAPDSAYSPAADLIRLLDHLGVERASVVGNSMGATLALDFTLEHPERVDRLVIVASGPSGFEWPEKDRERMRAVFRAARDQGLSEGVERWLAHPMVAKTIADPDAGMRLRTMVEENRNLFLLEHWPVEAMDPPALSRLSEVRVPTLVVVGDADMASVQEAADAAARGIPGAKKAVIRGADHLPQMLEPDEFNHVLDTFLKDAAH